MTINLKEFDEFMTGEFRKAIRDAYFSNSILHESDLQTHAWAQVQEFFQTIDPHRERYRVFSQFRVVRKKDKKTRYPDLVIIDNFRPWIFVELKAAGSPTTTIGESEGRLGRNIGG